MNCPVCNTPNRDDAKFCKKCGQPLHIEAAPATTPVENIQPQAQEQQQDNQVMVETGLAPVLLPVEVTVPALETEEDISTAPTMILSREKMEAIHTRRRQPNAAQAGQQPAATATAEPQEPANNPVANAPSAPHTLDAAPLEQPPASETPPSHPVPDLPDTPEPAVSPTSESATASEDTSAAVPPTGDEAAPSAPEQTAEPEANPIAQESQAQPSEQGQPAVNPAPSADFHTLEIGAILIGRYEVSQVISVTPDANTYHVIDHQGYQRCWNCGSQENTAGDEFCIDCGAELLNVAYTMHEYASDADASSEAKVIPGVIVNTFVNQGRTYAIEQEQAVQNPFPDGVRLVAASDSDAGNVRRSDPNEDSTLILQFQRIHESLAIPLGIYMVADGMGGHDNGQRASHLAISAISARILQDLLVAPLTAENANGQDAPASHPEQFDEDALVALVQSAVEEANAAICQENQQNKTDMGSTLTGFLIVGAHAYIFNVGDSRTYMLRGGQLYKKTNDHSLVGQLVAGGLIQPEDVYTHPQRSQIYRSLGDKLNIQVDVFKQELNPGDILLSCSDGLWEMVRDPEIESILHTGQVPQAVCTQLIETANKNGGEDNISAVLVYVH